MALDKQWRILAMIFIALALLVPLAAAFPGIGTETTVNKTHEGIQGGTGTGEYTVRFTTTAQQPGSYPAEGTDATQTNIGWYEMTRGNEPPNTTQIYITSSSGLNLSSDDITCYVNATDSDNTTLTINYNWYNSSVQIPSLSGQTTATSGILTNISTLSSSNTTAGENWTCEARAWDGYYNELKWNNASIIIGQISIPGGSKGGGGGGGGVERKEIKVCAEAWVCTEWSNCNLTRTRNCTDINNCGNEQYKPITTEICELRPVQRPPITITETIKREQERPPIIIEIPIHQYTPTLLEQARIKSRLKIEIITNAIIQTTKKISNGIIFLARTTNNIIHSATEKIQKETYLTKQRTEINMQKTKETITKTKYLTQQRTEIINGITQYYIQITQERTEINTQKTKETITKTKYLTQQRTEITEGTTQEKITQTTSLTQQTTETNAEKADQIITKTIHTTKEKKTIAAGMASILTALLTPENIEFILVAIIYFTLIAASIIAIRYFIRQYIKDERSRRLRTQTRALLAISIILQTIHFIIFQRELYPSYLAVIAIIIVFAFDMLIKKLPSIERKKEREEEKQHEFVLKRIRENREELQKAEELRRKLSRLIAPKPIEEKTIWKTEEKQRFTRIKNMIHQIKETHIQETTIHTLHAMKQRISRIRIPIKTKIKEYLDTRKQKKLLRIIDRERLAIQEQAKQINESKKQAIDQVIYEKKHKKDIACTVKDEREQWQKLEKNLQKYKKPEYTKQELHAQRYEKIKEEIMALEKPHKKETITLPKIKYTPISLPKPAEKYEKEINRTLQFQKKLDRYLEKSSSTKKKEKPNKKNKYDWVKREIRKMQKKH